MFWLSANECFAKKKHISAGWLLCVFVASPVWVGVSDEVLLIGFCLKIIQFFGNFWDIIKTLLTAFQLAFQGLLEYWFNLEMLKARSGCVSIVA